MVREKVLNCAEILMCSDVSFFFNVNEFLLLPWLLFKDEIFDLRGTNQVK